MIRVAAALVALLALAGGLRAEDVTLSARDGDLSLSGELLGYDGAYYRIDTEFGEMTLDGAKVACSGSACPDPQDFVARVTFSGAEAMARRLLPPLIETFARRNGYALTRSVADTRSVSYTLSRPDAGRPAGIFTLRTGTSAEGFADLIADEADLAMSLREVTPAEALLAGEAGRGQLGAPGRSRIIGLDALVPAVSLANPIETISFGDLARVARGEIADWSELDGSGLVGPIALHVIAPDTGPGQAFAALALGADPAFAPGATFHRSAEAVSAAVGADRRAIGITAFSALGNAGAVPLRGPCGAIATATRLTIKAEDYPLTTPAFLYAPARRLPDLATDFVDFATSPAAQGIVRRAGLVDQVPERVPLAQQGDRLVGAIRAAGDTVALSNLREMAKGLDGMARLSISFRFEDGSAALDAQSRSNVLLLAGAIARGAFDRHTIAFVGFSDGAGAANTNRRLSRRRAETVRAAIETDLGDGRGASAAFETLAYGEALPMACDETAWGRRVNRRVEVWLD